MRVGITSLLSWSWGIFSAVTLREVGMALSPGQVVGTIEGSRHFDVFRSPVRGTLSAVNERLVEEPGLLNRDPYGEGWFAEIRFEDAKELDHLQKIILAEPRISQLLRERGVRCFAAFPDFEMVDIGVECQAVLVRLNELMGRSTPGTVVHVVSDDKTAEVEMERWSDQTGNPLVDARVEGNLHHFVVKKR